MLSPNEQRELEEIQRMNEQLEQELNEGFESNPKYSSKPQTMTSNQYSSNPIKSMKRNNEPKSNDAFEIYPQHSFWPQFIVSFKMLSVFV